MLEVTLAFSREMEEDREWSETFNHMFRADDEALYPILEKMEMFLTQMGFVLDGKRLELIPDPTPKFGGDFSQKSDNIEVLFPSDKE